MRVQKIITAGRCPMEGGAVLATITEGTTGAGKSRSGVPTLKAAGFAEEWVTE